MSEEQYKITKQDCIGCKEYCELQQENQKLKEQLYSPDQVETACPKCGEKFYINYSREVYDLKNILTEFEKWLEEEKKKENWKYGDMYFNEFANIVLDKLQELKGDK